jgi:hypothetical protein
MTDLGTARKFLGLEFDQDENGGYYPSERQYVHNIVKRFHLEEAKPALTPMDHHTDLVMSVAGVRLDIIQYTASLHHDGAR